MTNPIYGAESIWKPIISDLVMRQITKLPGREEPVPLVVDPSLTGQSDSKYAQLTQALITPI
jgi:hypothetical protein